MAVRQKTVRLPFRLLATSLKKGETAQPLQFECNRNKKVAKDATKKTGQTTQTDRRVQTTDASQQRNHCKKTSARSGTRRYERAEGNTRKTRLIATEVRLSDLLKAVKHTQQAIQHTTNRKKNGHAQPRKHNWRKNHVHKRIVNRQSPCFQLLTAIHSSAMKSQRQAKDGPKKSQPGKSTSPDP